MSSIAQHGASLQNVNNDLVKNVEELREKRDELSRQLMKDEEEKIKTQNDIRILTERMNRINGDMSRLVQSRMNYDKTIQETEAAYVKILESSQTLLHVLKRESNRLDRPE